MPSTYSSSLKIELIPNGGQINTWGPTTNNNFQYALEEGITGYATATFPSNANYDWGALYTNSNTSQSQRNLVIQVTSSVSLSSQWTLYVPAIEKQYIIYNNTTGGQSITVNTTASLTTGVTIPNGKRMHVFVDGTNVVQMVDYFVSPTLITPTITGGQVLTVAALSGTNIDLSAGNWFTKTITANTTFTVSNVPASGSVASFVLELANAGNYTVTFWSNIGWADNASFTWSTWGTNLIRFTTDNAGASWFAEPLGRFRTPIVNTTFSSGSPWLYTFGNPGVSNQIGAYSTVFGAYFTVNGGKYAYSTDAVTWSVPTGNTAPPPAGYTQDIYYSPLPYKYWSNGSGNAYAEGNNIVVLGNNNGALTYSYDGFTWFYSANLVNNASWGAVAVTGLAFGNGVFVAVGTNGKCATSSDGINWTYRSGLSSTTFGSNVTTPKVTFTGTTFVVTGYDGTAFTGRAATSTDGITWTYQAGFATTVGANALNGNVQGSASNSSVILVPHSTSSAIYRSADSGVTWTTQTGLSTTTFGSSTISSIYWSGSVFVVGSTQNSYLATSTDGITWTYQAGLASATTWQNNLNTLALGSSSGSNLVCFQQNGRASTSTDSGVTWTYQDGLSKQTSVFGNNYNNYVRTFLYANSKFIGFGWSGRIITSPDGVNWTPNYGLLQVAGSYYGSTNTATSAIYDSTNAKYIVGASNGRVYTSADLATWTYQGSLVTAGWTTGDLNSMATNGSGLVIAVGTSSRAGYTNDGGATWTYSTLIAAWGINQTAYRVVYAASKFVAVGNGGKVATTTDGVTWTNQTGLSSTSFGTNIAYSLVYGNSKFVVGGANGAIATSTDGITWTYQSSLSATSWGTSIVFALVWTGNEFIALSNGKIASSPDGVTWTVQTPTWNLNAPLQVAVGNGTLVAGTTSGSLFSQFLVR